MEGGASVAEALLASSKSAEVLGGLGDNLKRRSVSELQIMGMKAIR